MTKFDIQSYDRFLDIPLRGLLNMGSSVRAFEASELGDEPVEIADRSGVYSSIRVFDCGDVLHRAFKEKIAIFNDWRARFDAGLADKATHPLYADQNYQRLSSRVDRLFETLGPPVFESTGVMHVVDGRFVFECLPNANT
jgi:hypothetical protein